MCGLCQTAQPFVHPWTDPAERDKVRAKQLKQSIALHEESARLRAEQGQALCEESAERLKAMKAEQYRLARKL